jgi:hypothetical protein
MEIEKSFEYFIRLKNDIMENSIEALVYPTIVSAVSTHGNLISTSEIWDLVTRSLEGNLDEKAITFYSADHGLIYRNKLTKLICDKFGAKMRHRNTGNVLIFNSDYLLKMGKIYGESSGIQSRLVFENDVHDSSDASIDSHPLQGEDKKTRTQGKPNDLPPDSVQDCMSKLETSEIQNRRDTQNESSESLESN